jgi:hypothetical protein
MCSTHFTTQSRSRLRVGQVRRVGAKVLERSFRRINFASEELTSDLDGFGSTFDMGST